MNSEQIIKEKYFHNNTNEIVDKHARLQALDPSQSFIVQAPAGSGKTELLITRFLNLLLYVDKPEEVLALTFTRKAAAEMKRRIIENLINCQTFLPCKDHNNSNSVILKNKKNIQQISWQVLQRDKLKEWQLLKNPSRLRIMTLDSFCAKIVRQLPLHSELHDIPTVNENPYNYYVQAIDNLLIDAEGNLALSTILQNLLEQYDYSWEKVKNFLIYLLQTREQWLPYLKQLSQENFSVILNHNLEAVINIKLSKIHNYLDTDLQEEWLKLFQFSRQQLQNLEGITIFVSDSFPKANALYLQQWKNFIHIILNKDGTLRKKIDKRLGFPAFTTVAKQDNKILFKEMKERMHKFLAHLDTIEGLNDLLAEIMLLPPLNFSNFQNNVLGSLLILLKELENKLKKIFFQNSTADFITIQLAAATSLGSEDEPSDLLLKLDETINHILIDEFQDTSNSQYNFLKTLTAGWQINDGRTLFLVGDPQQSIYGFRAAEVGLFLKAQRNGIGDIKLIPLSLKVNFRSQATLIQWYNKIFQKLFPHYDDEISGAVRFNNAYAFLEKKDDCSNIKLHVYDKKKFEKNTCYLKDIVKLIEEKIISYPNHTIAVLVRNRKHALPLLDALHTANIAYKATGIKKFIESSTTLDLLSLVRACLSLNDHIAWLAILRAPWCGLTLHDLLLITQNKKKCILELLQSSEIIASLSMDGQKRLSFFLPIISHFIENIGYQSFPELIETLWVHLMGPATLDNSAQFSEVIEFFNLLENFCQKKSALFNYQEFFDFFQNENFDENYQHSNPIQVMTIHKAKGLEFDHVILLGLERLQKNDANSLLVWQEFVTLTAQQPSVFLLAPLHLGDNHDKQLYQFLRQGKKQKQDYEELRLFYVAVTRAKRCLNIFMQLTINEENFIYAPSSLLIKKLWPLICQECTYVKREEPFLNYPFLAIEKTHRLKRFANLKKADLNLYAIREASLLTLNSSSFFLQENPAISLNNQVSIARHFNLETITGTVIHEILCDISKTGLHSYFKGDFNLILKKWLIRLKELGATKKQIPMIMKRVHHTLTILPNDSSAVWLLDPNHLYAQSEWVLYFKNNECIIVDRTFIIENTRWIIDYKTDIFISERHSLEEFLNLKKYEHQLQLQHYAKIIKKFDQESLQKKYTLKLGLYFPCIPACISWEEFNI